MKKRATENRINCEALLLSLLGKDISQKDEVTALPFFIDIRNSKKSVEGFLALFEGHTYVLENGEIIYKTENSKIKQFELDEGFGVVYITALLESGERITVAAGDMSRSGEFSEKVGQLTLAATGHEAEFGSTKKTFVNKGRRGSPPPFGKGNGAPPSPPGGNHGRKDGKPPKSSFKQSVKWLLSMMKPSKWGILLSVIIFFAITAVRLVAPRISREMVDGFLGAKLPGEIADYLWLVLLLLATNIGQRLLTVSRSLLLNKVGNDVIIRLRESVFGKVQKMSLEGINKMTSGELMQRVTRDTQNVKMFITNDFPQLIEQVLMFAGVFLILLLYDWKLALIILAPSPFIMLFWWLFRRKIHRIYSRQWQLESVSRSILHDIFSGIRVVKSYGSEHSEINKYDKVIKEEKDVQIKNEKFFCKTQPFLNYFMGIGEFFILFYCGNAILDGGLSLGQMLEFSSYASLMYEPLRWFVGVYRRIMRLVNSVNRIYDVMEDSSELQEGKGIEADIEGKIEFKNVVFGYEKGNSVLENINLTVNPGEMVGLVGRSGVGKSTLINLIMRMYDVDKGKILIDGTDIKDISENSLRSQMGVVLQETFLFSGTVYDNIAYAKPNATHEEVINAARSAGAHKFIVKMQDGYNTFVGEKGYTLSGGERQRIAIARALLRNPKILILDEATSALDTETEKEIQESINKLSENRTTIAIAHRLSTLRNCTRIIVLDKGQIAEEGSHEELMKKGGIYSGLVLAQRQMFRIDK